MQPKQGGYERAAIYSPGHSVQHIEQEESIEDVDYKIDKMESARIAAEKLAVGHKRQPGQGMPVKLHGRGKRPFETFKGPSLKDVRVFEHVGSVIVIDKLVSSHPPEDDEHGCSQTYGD